MEINLEQLEQLYNEAYEVLRTNERFESGIREDGIVEMFDEVLNIPWMNEDVIAPFNRMRGDIISSDREAMAFLVAFDLMISPRAEELWAKLFR